jgi:hypothetical protein
MYKNHGFKMVSVKSLVPYSGAAKIPMDQEDVESLAASVEELGAVVVPLIVSAKTDSQGRHEIYDGVHRWNIARTAGMTDVPAVMIETSDPQAIIATCISIGRKRTTGQRVMLFLEAHKREVLAYRESVSGGQSNLKKGKEISGPPNGGPGKIRDFERFSAIKIAFRLRCSTNDVEPGILLLYLIETKDFKALLGEYGAPDGFYDYLCAQRDMIISGSQAIRKWKSAAMGRATTVDAPRKSIDYVSLATKSTVSIVNVFRHWSEIQVDDVVAEALEENIGEMISKMPAPFVDVAAQAICDSWSVAQKESLVRRLGAAPVAKKGGGR